jgi:small subunit ribosomal protein S6
MRRGPINGSCLPASLRRLLRPEEGVSTIRAYEVVYILDPSLPDDELTALKERFAEVARTHGGQVSDVTTWDRRRLAYDIKGQREGVYVIMNMNGEPNTLTEVDRVLRFTEPVLRHMIVRTDET